MGSEVTMQPGRPGRMVAAVPCVACDEPIESQHPAVISRDTAGGHYHFHPRCWALYLRACRE